MDSNYVFLCGVMWCKFGQKDAGNELLRAADSGDPDMKALAWAMFAKGVLLDLIPFCRPDSHPRSTFQSVYQPNPPRKRR
jgi:hypothetical protein